MSAPFVNVAWLVGEPERLAQRCSQSQGLSTLAATALASIVVGSGSFGLVLGSTRGLTQALMAGVKLPLIWVLALCISVPALYMLSALFGRGHTLRYLVALTLAASARASLVLMALSPVLWLIPESLVGMERAYHQVMLSAIVLFSLSGLFALGVLLRGLRHGGRSVATVLAYGLLLFFVVGQSAWSLRPFVGRPAQASVPWFRSPEGTFLGSLSDTSRSARGIYNSER